MADSLDATEDPPAKVCMFCGLDCSDRPRVKDAQGRYACKTCVADGPIPHREHEATVPPAAAEDRGYDLVEPQSPTGSAAPARRSCPACLRQMQADVDRCVYCGFNRVTGLQASTEVGGRPLGKRGMNCAHCGYNLTGLKALRCPECGTAIEINARRAYDRQVSREVLRQSYLTPILMLVIGAGVASGIVLLNEGPLSVAFYLLGYVFQVPIGVGVFLACCALWIGFDAPIHLTALRLAGVYAVTDLASILVEFLPFGGIVLWLVPLLLYVYLLSEQLEIDLQDAAIVGVATFIVKLAVFGLLLFYGASFIN